METTLEINCSAVNEGEGEKTELGKDLRKQDEEKHGKT